MSQHTYITRMGGEEFIRLFEDYGHERSFWLDRGIDPEVAAMRPYEPWLRDDIEPVKRAHASIERKGQRLAISRKARLEDGLIIHRRPVFPDLDPILPELRPNNPISTGRPRRHWHGHGERPKDDRYYTLLDPYSESGKKHIAKEHPGGNIEELHETRSPGKYHMPPSPYVVVTRPHDHDKVYKPPKTPHEPAKYSDYLSPEERRARHVAKYHGGLDVAGEHEHDWPVKDEDHAHGRRVDIHPWAVPLLESAELVYFGIEGCLKADSILSAIRRENRNESVFSVPSVGQWLAPELDDFIIRRLRGKVVVIVPDADWVDNHNVIEQARMCRTYLQRRGVEAYIAAPPLQDGKVKDKGVDDYLGKGRGSLDGLMVQTRYVDAGNQRAWLKAFHLRKDTLERAAAALYGLAAHADAEGRFHGTLARLSKVIGVERTRVGRAIRALEALGAITVDGDLAIRRNWFTKGPDWSGPNPVITLIPELRGKDLPPYPLGQLLANLRAEQRSA